MAVGRIYSANITNTAVTLAQDLISIKTSAAGFIEVLEFGCSQSTKVGDANEAQLIISLRSGFTTQGSGGTVITPVKRNLADTAFGGVAHANDTTVSNTGTEVVDETWNWNVRVPFQRIFTPETTKIIGASSIVRLALTTAPASSTTISAYIIFKEFP